MQKNRRKQFLILHRINEHGKEISITNLWKMFKPEAKKEKIPFSTFRYSVQVLINEKLIESVKRKDANSRSRGLSLFISPKKNEA